VNRLIHEIISLNIVSFNNFSSKYFVYSSFFYWFFKDSDFSRTTIKSLSISVLPNEAKKSG